MSAARKLKPAERSCRNCAEPGEWLCAACADRPPEFMPSWAPANDIARRVAGMKRAAVEGLRNRSLDADEFATAKLCHVALRAMPNPSRAPRGAPQHPTPAERKAIHACLRRARKHCGNCAEPGKWLCGVCATVCGLDAREVSNITTGRAATCGKRGGL